jgi:hypothetical protein
VADIQEEVRALRTRRKLSVLAVAVEAVLFALVALVTGTFNPVFAAIAVPFMLAAVLQTQRLGRMRAAAGAVEPAGRPQTHAEAVAEAIEVRRQQQWDAIAGRAHLAMGGAVRATPAPASKPPMSALPPARTLPVTGMTTMADFAAGVARLSAAAAVCAHPDAEPVNLLVTGETVAWVCPDCPAELPAGWR